MRKVLIILLALVCFTGCTITLGGKSELDEILERGNYIIVDVRSASEYNEGHIKGAINIPYTEIGNYKLDKTKTILVYCKSGSRSKSAHDVLEKLGYDVYDMGAYDDIDLEKE